MKLAVLDAHTLAAIQTVRCDRSIEKHEGPATWDSVLKWQVSDGGGEVVLAGKLGC